MNTIMLNGFLAEIELDEKANLLRGTVINSREKIQFAGGSLDELRENFATQLRIYHSKVGAEETSKVLRRVSEVEHRQMVRSASLTGRHEYLDNPWDYHALQEAYDILLQELSVASEAFKHASDDGRTGLALAAKSVALFLARRWENPELAAPFMNLARSLLDLEQGKKPPLLSVGKVGRRRPRSSAADHQRMCAAALLEVKVNLFREELEVAAREVERKCAQWLGFEGVDLSFRTIIDWRSDWRSKTSTDRVQFDKIVARLSQSENPKRAVDQMLKNGPPGTPRPDRSR